MQGTAHRAAARMLTADAYRFHQKGSPAPLLGSGSGYLGGRDGRVAARPLFQPRANYTAIGPIGIPLRILITAVKTNACCIVLRLRLGTFACGGT